jgi:UDP-3-O-[3-hydroxymyristoyl] glucosamine N-acyltransferase
VSLSWQQLHDLIGIPAGEESDLVLNGVGSLNTAKGDEISFLGNSRYVPQLATTSAGVVLVPSGDYPAAPGCHFIEVENPSLAFSKLIDYFQPEVLVFHAGISSSAIIAEDAVVDPTEVCVAAGAIIESGAQIGRGTTIGPGCVIGKGAQIGEDCLFYANASIREFCVIGDRVILQPGVVIGSDGYGFELIEGRHRKVPQVGIVEIANDVEVGANSTIDRARFGKTYIGEGTKIDNLVQIAHNVEIGKHCLIVAQVGIAGSTRIGNYVTVAAQSGIGGHLEIGDHVVLAAKTAALKSLLKPGAYMGVPARPMASEQKKMALVSRLPKLVKEVQELKKKLEQLS